jgi:hypothetical protein
MLYLWGFINYLISKAMMLRHFVIVSILWFVASGYLFSLKAQFLQQKPYNNKAFETELKGPVKSQKMTVIVPIGLPNLRNIDIQAYILEEKYNNERQRTVENLYNLENVLIAKSEILHDMNGFATEVIYTDLFGNMLNRITYSYYPDGNWKQAVNYDPYYNPLGIFDYSYTENGHISEIKQTNEEGYMVETELFSYDDQGNLTEQTLYNNNGKEIADTEFLYNSKKRVISYRTFANEDSLIVYFEANYQNDTLLTDAIIEYYADNKPIGTIEYTYDPLGNIIKTVETDLTGKKKAETKIYVYEWDLWGNWTKQLIKKEDDIEVAASRSISYFE